MSEIPKAYEPQSVEDKWYDFWLKQGCFTADPARVSAKRPAYAIVIPPPNVTGMLHMGHVLNNTSQDILARKARMDGKEVLWLPGTDHAGISTEGMVAKQLRKEGKDKKDVGREEFIKRAWTWKEKHGGIIIEQLKKLGCSCDWTRERFTMDEAYVACVKKVFVELYKQGLIYRGKRMVNWCPATQTALSDEEVEMKSQKGFMYHFKVEVVDATPSSHGKVAATPSSPAQSGSGGAPATSCDGGVAATFLTIATTRPETIPGDTAVAVNPNDPRYAHLIGKHVIRPLPPELPLEKKLIPIIGDEHVDFEFGTGVLKVTPAHDKADFEIGQRHKLPLIEVINADGSMGELAGADLRGLDRFKARKVAEEKLTELGVLVEAKPYENSVGFSQRADVPIEPRLSEQWFLKYPAVEESKACVEQEGSADFQIGSDGNEETSRFGNRRSDKMRFHPQRWAKVYDHWLTNIQDWCISRQLWWGHRIPVWRKVFKKDSPDAIDLDHGIARNLLDDDLVELFFAHKDGEKSYTRNQYKWVDEDHFEVAVATDSDVEAKALEQYGFTQDPDVLDTWFSSWLWPFATMDWTGNKSQDSNNPTLQAFYPTTDLVTGPDIIFFWVARMIMAGYEFMGDLPFKNVYFTGIIRDKQGRKMSKMLGNSPDPLVLIAQYGADALRFGTMRSAPLGQDVLFDEKDVELGRNFCNKLWNACRFRQMVGGSDASSPNQSKRDGGVAATSGDGGVATTCEVQGEINPQLLTTDDKWILLKLNQAIREITTALADYKFNEAAQTLYRFFWSEYCDWYVEASKAVLAGSSRRESAQTSGEESQSGLTSAATNERKANTLAVIDFVLSHTLRLFHPFLPFITEELWHGMGYSQDMPAGQGGKTIMNAPWPKPFDGDFRDAYGLDDSYLEFAAQKYEVVTQGRNLRRIGNIQSGKRVKFVLKPNREILPHDAEVIKTLLNAEAIEINGGFAAKKGTPTALTPLGELFLPLEGLVDVEGEKARLKKELEKVNAEIAKGEQKLANPNFTQRVPPQVLQEHQQRLADWQVKHGKIEAALKDLEG